MNASWKITKELTIGGNYSYLDTKATVYNSAHGRFQQAIIDGMAHNKWNAFANYGHRFSPCYNMGINLSTRGSSKRFYENDGNGKGFQIWRLNTTHDLGKSKTTTYRLEVGVDNIFNYRDTTPRPCHLGTTTAGTTIYASFAIIFNKGKKITTSKTITKQQENDED